MHCPWYAVFTYTLSLYPCPPQTSLVSRALDAFEDEATRAEVRDQLLKYFETDTVWYVHAFCSIWHVVLSGVGSYHADSPEVLVRLQETHWKPILDWARSTFNVDIAVTNSFLVPVQPPETIEKLKEVLSNFSPWEMAGTFPQSAIVLARVHDVFLSHGASDVHLEVVPDRTCACHAPHRRRSSRAGRSR